MNNDPKSLFAKLMQMPDSDQATKQYETLGTEIRKAIAQEIPELTKWVLAPGSEKSKSACDKDQYPGVGFDGETISLPIFVVDGKISDRVYEHALRIVGTVAQKHGFNPVPQRLHDSPNNHDAVFHNVHDDGEISLGTALSTVLGLDLGCRLTAETKRRGTPSGDN